MTLRAVQRLAVGFAGLVLLAAILFAGLSGGARPLSPGVILTALIRPVPGDFDHFALWQFRLPRLFAAALTGSALALSGMILQSTLRNPLAEPQILGLNAGAVLAMTLATSFGLEAGLSRGLLAVCGAAVALALLLLLAGGGKYGLRPLRVTLCGLVISAFAGAITSAVLLLDTATFSQLRGWLAGDLAGQSWPTLAAALPLWIGGVVLSLALVPHLVILSMGDVLAIGLGVNIRRLRLLAVAAAALLAGTAVSLAGPIGFLGLVVPHILRPRFAAGSRAAYLTALPVGAALLILADLLARMLISPVEIPTGVLTGALGAAAFITLAARISR